MRRTDVALITMLFLFDRSWKLTWSILELPLVIRE